MHLRSHLSYALLVAVLSAQISPAVAQAAGKQIDISLKSGAQYSGKLVERVPGDHVTIELATGEVKRFEWEDLAEDENAPKPTPKKPSPAPSTPSPEDEGYYVTIETEQKGVVLERLIGSSSNNVEHWKFVCSAPCDTTVAGGSEYRLGGAELRKSSAFTIDRTTNIKAKLGHPVAFWGGVASTIVGSLTTIVGVAALDAASEEKPVYGFDGSGNYVQTGTETGKSGAAWGVTIIGVSLVAVGVVLLVSNSNDISVNGNVVARGRSPGWAGVRVTPNGFTF